MHRETGRVDPQFDKMTDADMLLQHAVRDLKTLAVLGVHGNTIDKLITVGESLFVELLLEG